MQGDEIGKIPNNSTKTEETGVNIRWKCYFYIVNKFMA